MPQPRNIASVTFRALTYNGVLVRPLASSQYAFKAHRDVLLLIHGFNVSEEEAIDSYQGFASWQRKIGKLQQDDPIFSGQLVEIYWPGNANWSWRRPIPALFYPQSIVAARRTARRLAETLSRSVGPLDFRFIDIVAHSMGCRIALETLKHLRRMPRISVRRVVLMAAAVPTFMLEVSSVQNLRTVFYEKLNEGALSLFSGCDLVLFAAFRAGQSLRALAGEGVMPRALGSTFWPPHPYNLEQKEVAGAGHSDYWGHEGKHKKQEREVNQHVRSFLKLDRVRRIASRSLAERAVIDERSEPEPRPVGTKPAPGTRRRFIVPI